MFGLPLVFLPCREALLSMPSLFRKLMVEGGETETVSFEADKNISSGTVSAQKTRMSGLTKEGHVVINGIDFDEERPLLKRNSSIIPMISALQSGNVIPMKQLMAGDSSSYGSTNSPDESHPHVHQLKRNTSTIPKRDIVQTGSVIPMKQLMAGGSFAYCSNNSSATTSEDEKQLVELPMGHKGNIDSAQEKDNSASSPRPVTTVSPPYVNKEDGATIQFRNENESISSQLQKCSSFKSLGDRVQKEEKDEEKVVVSNTVHVLSTICILAFGYVCAVAVPGVGFVWSICGSSMSLIIGFFIPAACYLKIRSRKKLNPRSFGAWSMLIFSVIASIVCTIHVVMEASKLDDT